jgi:hypothetical protein
LLLAGLLAAFICVHLRFLAAAAAAAPAMKPSIFQYELQVSGPNMQPQKRQQTIWMKGPRYRVETTLLGAKGKELMIGGPDGVYLMVPGMKEAMQLPAQAGAKMGPNITADVAQLRKQKKLGTEKVGRYTADIYEQRSEVAVPGAGTKVKNTTRIWISRDVPVPVKTLNTMQGGFRMVQTLKSAKVNVPIADNLFSLPKGTKVRPAGQ